jgi:hypothetical protein
VFGRREVPVAARVNPLVKSALTIHLRVCESRRSRRVLADVVQPG